MSNTFHPDEVPEHLKAAAADCQDVANSVRRKLLGPFQPEDLTEYPSMPRPALEGQVLNAPVFDTLSWQVDRVESYIAIGGRWWLLNQNLTRPPVRW
jgi:hypothetical protein